MLMKQLTNAKSILAGVVLAGTAVIGGTTAWGAAGILGLALLAFSVTLRQPKLVPVRIRSQPRRS